MIKVEVKNANGIDTGLIIHLGNSTTEWIYNPKTIDVGHKAFNPVCYHAIIEHTIDCLVSQWKPTGKLANKPEFFGRAWAKKKFAKLINWSVYKHWQKYISNMSGTDYMLAKQLFMADIKGSEGAVNILLGKAQLDSHQMYEISNYKLAALLAVRKPFAFCESGDWRSYFSCDGSVNEDLRDTLDNFKYAVPFHIIENLKDTYVRRPLLSKLEFVSAISSYARHRPLLFKADKKEVNAGLKKIDKDVSLRKSVNISNLAARMTFYEDKFNGSLVDLAQKSLAVTNHHFRSYGGELIDDKKPLSFSPIIGPNIPNVNLLSTVGEVRSFIEKYPSNIGYYNKLLYQNREYGGFLFSYTINGECGIMQLDSDGNLTANNMQTPSMKIAYKSLENWLEDLTEEDFAV